MSARETEPIWIPCEGSGCPPAGGLKRSRICAMCGAPVPFIDGLALTHQRRDILAMIDRGDFDAPASLERKQ